MRVDVKSFGAKHADEQQRKPVLARGQPVDVEPPSRGQQNAKEVLAVLTDAELHDRDATRVVSGNHGICHSLPFSKDEEFKSRTNRGRKKNAAEAEKINEMSAWSHIIQ